VIREAAANNHNLRPRPQRPSSEVEIATPNEEIDDADNETTGDFLSDNEGHVCSLYCDLPHVILYLIPDEPYHCRHA